MGRGIIFNLFVIIVLGAVLYAVTRFSAPIKTQVATLQSKVLGESTSVNAIAAEHPLAKELEQDIKEQVEETKEKRVDKTVNTVTDTVGRVKKIIDDIKGLQEAITTQLEKL